jgi:hypothetical protein
MVCSVPPLKDKRVDFSLGLLQIKLHSFLTRKPKPALEKRQVLQQTLLGKLDIHT